MDSMPLPPPPPPPLPGTEGSIHIPTYKESQEASLRAASVSPAFDQNNNCADFVMDPLREQQYANLPSKLSSCMNKDKKPFTYTIGGAGEKGILDLNQIKSPRMKKRLQANLRGDEDPKNEIRPQSSLASDHSPILDQVTSSFDREFASPSASNSCPQELDPMVRDLVHGSSSSPPTQSSAMRYQIPLPPPTTIQSLENLSLGLPTSGNTNPAPYNHRYKNPESGLEDQFSTGLKLDSNNNSGHSYNFNNHNNSPKPFSPGSSVPFSSTPFEKQATPQPQAPPVMNKAPTLAQQASTPSVGFSMKSIEEYENSFPRPPPPTVSLIPGREKELPRAKSPIVANPSPVVYAPNVQDQWLAKKQQQQQPYPSPYGQQAVQRPMPVSSGPQFNRSNSYDRKMQDIREAHSDILPPNPQTAYAPTLQEQWMMKKQNPNAYQVPVAATAAPAAPMHASAGTAGSPGDQRRSFVVVDPPIGSEYRSEPMQSKSFRLLQKLTEGIEDELEEFKALQEMNRLDNEKRQRQQQVQQQQQVPQQQTQYSYPQSNVVPNPPQVYAPTLQEQWMAKKSQQQQQQPLQHQAPVRPAPPAPSSTGYQSLASSSASPASLSRYQTPASIADSGKEYVIPIQVQERTREQTSRQEQQQQVTRTTVGDFSSIPRLPPLTHPQIPASSISSCSFPSSMSMDPFTSPFPATTGFY